MYNPVVLCFTASADVQIIVFDDLSVTKVHIVVLFSFPRKIEFSEILLSLSS